MTIKIEHLDSNAESMFIAPGDVYVQQLGKWLFKVFSATDGGEVYVSIPGFTGKFHLRGREHVDVVLGNSTYRLLGIGRE